MINIDALDTVIALVVVILVLSLVVQSVQAALKKAFKIKSRQIEDSLVDLFETALKSPGPETTGWFVNIPFLRWLFRRRHPAEYADAAVRGLYYGVLEKFREIGRVAQSANCMLDSISKQDLLKVLEQVPVKALSGNEQSEQARSLQRLSELIKTLMTNINSIQADSLGNAAASIAEVQRALAPLFNITLFNSLDNRPAPELTFKDIGSLREIKFGSVLDSLAAARNNAGENVELIKTLDQLAATIRKLASEYALVIASLDSRITEVKKEISSWYDTVMHSFEERYTRSMKTWALVISAVVVVVLNANMFNIYRDISTSDVTRNLIVQQGPEILRRSREQTASQPLATETEVQTTSTQTTTRTKSAPQEAGLPNQAPGNEAELPSADEVLKAEVDKIKSNADLYTSFGFKPLSWQQVAQWWSSLFPDRKVIAQDGIDYSVRDWPGWRRSRKHDVKVLIGWALTVLLLSIGAPFWQDTLESLFGLKNLIRKNADLKNVEREPGAGNPKA